MTSVALKTFSNEMIFEETAHRLKRLHFEKCGREFLFGDIAFVFHDGRFQGVEERSKLRIFREQRHGGENYLEAITY